MVLLHSQIISNSVMASSGEIETAAIDTDKHLGYESLKPLQLEVVGIVGGRDVFVGLPIGYGKSLCYSCLPWTFDRICSPPLPTPSTAVHCFCFDSITTIVGDQLQ